MTLRLFLLDQLLPILEAIQQNINHSLAEAFARIRLYRARMIQRRQLAELDERALKDMGISHAARSEELRKAFWQD